jgi:hypothetical protein
MELPGAAPPQYTVDNANAQLRTEQGYFAVF